MLMTVHAPRLIRSPSCRGICSPAGISRPFSRVPLADPGSRIDQLPSDVAIRTADARVDGLLG
jgi:hypothetical protein